MDDTSKPGEAGGSLTPSTALLDRRLATSNAPAMPTPCEIDLLRQSKREIADRSRARAAELAAAGAAPAA